MAACIAMGLASTAAVAAGIDVRRVETKLADNVYWLNAEIGYDFSNKALKALDNGVPITVQLDIQVSRQRNYLWDERIASLEQRYQLRYRALTKRYLLKNLNSASERTFPSLKTALAALGKVRRLPMLDKNLLDDTQRYIARIRASLDIEALPVPLRLLAYFSSAWHLSSEWYQWRLKP
ncbi:MAG TPA: DUF4390 domain-containing protein [Gammaproteobacteria bacterium]|nr:DUF4390 domain-containing protein [Gammaproteobacteria bacterium]